MHTVLAQPLVRCQPNGPCPVCHGLTEQSPSHASTNTGAGPQGYIALQSACRIAAPGAPSVLGLVVSGTAGWPDSGNGTTTGVLAVCGYFFQPEAQPGRLADFDVTCVPTRPANGIASAATTRAPLTPAENNELALKFLAGDEFGKN